MSAWFVNEHHTTKTVHRGDCRFARPDRPYIWAGDRTADALARALIDTGSWIWHRGCRRCSADLDDQLLGIARLGDGQGNTR